jgi:hypothetical protein
VSENWIVDPTSWNKVQLGNILLPGIAIVTTSRGREIDFKKAPSKDGGTSTDKGANAAKVKIRLTMKASQWAEWQACLPYIEPRDGKPTGPLSIVHPYGQIGGTSALYTKDRTDRTTNEGAGLLTSSGLERLEFLEQSLGPPARQGVTVLEDPVTGVASMAPAPPNTA